MRTDEELPLLIHYLGDNLISKPAPHGNSLKQTTIFTRTKPSAMKEFESKIEKEQAIKVYKKFQNKQKKIKYCPDLEM